jgi:hypothetical protein
MVAPASPETDPFESAVKALKAGDLEEARRILTALVTKNPRSVTGWELVYQASKNDGERVHALKAILKLSPNHPWALKKLSILKPGLRSIEESKSELNPVPGAPVRSKRGKKRRKSTFIVTSIIGFAILVCATLWIAFFYRWGMIPLYPFSNGTQTAVAANRAACQVLIDRALAASSNLCNRIGSDQACYGNNTVNARLVPGADQKFSVPGDIIGVNQIESISTSVLNPTLKEWGIAIFKVISNLPRSLPGETITLVVFGNTTLENSASLETYYFYSGLGQVACDQIPFDGLMITMPEGTGIHFKINGSELILMGNASLHATKNGTMDVNLYSGSGSIESQGQQQIISAGESVSVPLGGSTGTDPIGPPSAPEPLSPDDLAVVCSMTGTYCDQANITPVPSDIAAQLVLTANAHTSTSTPTHIPTATNTATLTASPTATSTPSPSPSGTFTRTPTKTSTHTQTATRTATRTQSPPPVSTQTYTPTPSQTNTPTETSDTLPPTFTPSLTHTPVTGAIFVQIVDPGSDGAVVSNNSDTTFEAEAWDTAVGMTNGDGINHVYFWFTFAGAPVHPLPDAGDPQVQNDVRYCPFTGTSTCLTMDDTLGAGTFSSLTPGTYTMHVQASGSSGVSEVYTRTFEIP